VAYSDPHDPNSANAQRVFKNQREFGYLGVYAHHGGDWELVLNTLERALVGGAR
jgi:hypothetical protein